MKTTQRRNTKQHSLLKWQEEQDKKTKQKKRFDLLSSVIFAGAIILAIRGINIYHKTFIDWQILVAPFMTGGVLGILISWRKLLKHNYPVWSAFLIGFGTGSFILYFSFLFINAKLADTSQTTEVFTVEETGRLASRFGEPYAIINFYGLSKQIVFSLQDIDSIDTALYVKIAFSKGLLGYDIIRTKSLE